MDPLYWRKLEECAANVAKYTKVTYDELKKVGFSHRDAINLTVAMIGKIASGIESEDN